MGTRIGELKLFALFDLQLSIVPLRSRQLICSLPLSFIPYSFIDSCVLLWTLVDVFVKGLCNNYQEGGGGLKNERGALPKIAAKIGGLKSKITHLTEGGGGGLKFYSKCK